MKVRFLIRKEPQNPHWWQLPQAPEDKSFTCFLLASFPVTMGSFPIRSASWSEGERDKVCDGTGPFGGCLASLWDSEDGEESYLVGEAEQSLHFIINTEFNLFCCQFQY